MKLPAFTFIPPAERVVLSVGGETRFSPAKKLVLESAITHALMANRTRPKFIPASAFQASAGAPSFAQIEAAGHWLLDAASTEGVSASWVTDTDWVSGTYAVYLYLAPVTAGGAGSREVAMLLNTSVTASGAVIGSGSTANVISTGASDNELLIVAHSRMITVTAAGELIGLTLQRLGDDGADDLASDLRFFGIRLDYTGDM